MEKNALKRVVLTGAESTGKTTLARRLAAAYETVWAPEYVRLFVEEKGRLPEPADVDAIARGHLAGEAALLPRARRVLFLDTDLISSCIYNSHYFGACPTWIREASVAHQADLYLLADNDIPWAPDPGQRENRAVRDALQARFEEALLSRGVRWVKLSGPIEQRLVRAKKAVDRLLSGE